MEKPKNEDEAAKGGLRHNADAGGVRANPGRGSL
jgi:hypothetical protein